MSKKKHQPPVHISVTIDFLKTLPCLDVENNENHLRAALYAVGIDIDNELGGKNGVNYLRDVNVRCVDKPYMYRQTTVINGTLRKDFRHSNIYKDGFLDAGFSEAKELCSNLPFDIPLEVKANTRKYTKKSEKEILLCEISDLDRLDDIFGNDGLGAE